MGTSKSKIKYDEVKIITSQTLDPLNKNGGTRQLMATSKKELIEFLRRAEIYYNKEDEESKAEVEDIVSFLTKDDFFFIICAAIFGFQDITARAMLTIRFLSSHFSMEEVARLNEVLISSLKFEDLLKIYDDNRIRIFVNYEFLRDMYEVVDKKKIERLRGSVYGQLHLIVNHNHKKLGPYSQSKALTQSNEHIEICKMIPHRNIHTVMEGESLEDCVASKPGFY